MRSTIKTRIGNLQFTLLPQNRTTIGAALVDTSNQIATGTGIAVTGTILAGLFAGDISSPNWGSQEAASFQDGVTIAGLTLTIAATALVVFGIARGRTRGDTP